VTVPEQPIPSFPTLPAALSHWAAVRPDDVAYVFASSQEGPDHTVGYRELEQSALGVAAFLQKTARPGDRVLLLLPPGLDYLTAFLGCLYAGTVAVPLYPPRPGAKLDRIEAVVRDCRPAHALSTGALLEHLQDLPRTAGARGLRLHAVEGIGEAGPGVYEPVALDGGDLAFLQYTSGSTGQPKGVMVGHGNLVDNERAITEGFGVRSDDVILSWLPLYHDMGLIGTALLPLYVGVKAVLLDTFAFIHDPLIWPEAVSRYAATCSGGPNFAYQLLADRYDAQRLAGIDLGSWHVAFNGAEPVIPATLESFAALYGRHGFDRGALYPCYGLAEATLFVSGAERMGGYRSLAASRRAIEGGRLEEAAPAEDGDRLPVVACGRAAARTEIVIRSADGHALPDGEVGEICVRGPGVAGGYWEQPEASEETFRARVTGREGTFLRTGDLGALRDGQLYPVGRSKDLIIVAGRNFYPHDIENLASSVSGDLRRGCAAAFQPDAAGPRVVLVVEAARSAASRLRADATAVRELGAAVRRRVGAECGLDVADVVFVFPGSLPKTSSGKIRRAETRQRFLDGRLRLIGEARAPYPGPEQTGPDVVPPDPADRSLRPEAVRGALARLVAAHAGTELAAEDFALPLAALGLDSLKLVALRGGIERQSGRRLDTSLFFGDRSLDDVVEALVGAPAAPEPGPGETAGDPGALPDPGSYPATEGQVQFQFRHELLPEDTAHNLPVALRVGRRLEPDRIRDAVAAVIGRHAALRSTLGEPGTGTQVLHEPGALPLDFTHWETATDDESEALGLLRSVAHRRFDLTGGPLVRTAAVLSPGSTVLLLTAHHAVVDYWSLRIVLAELLSALLDVRLPAPGPAPGAVDWCRHQARTQETPSARERTARAAEKWRPLREHLLFPSDGPAPRRRTPAGVVDFALDADLTHRVYADAKAHGHTPFVLLAAAYLRALHEVTGQERIVVGTPYHNRDDWRFAGTVGYLVNMVPLLGDFRDVTDPADLRSRTWREVRGSLENADVPFFRLVKALEPPRHGQNPLFQATLTFQQSADGLLDDGFSIPWSGSRQVLGGTEVRAFDIPPRDTAFAVGLYGARDGDRLVFRLEHQEHLVPARAAGLLRDAFRTALAALVAQAAPLSRTGTAGG
jgi:acyl-CoA synthetase (AMP-forming)/AMP-acid ligase II